MQQRDSSILRKMADEAQRDEAQMYLRLLADLVDSREWRVAGSLAGDAAP